MITFQTNAEDVAVRLNALREEFPKEFGRGMATLGIAFRSRIKKALRSGVTPDGSVAELNPLTRALRNPKGIRGFAGKLQNALRYRVTGRDADRVLTVGFTASATAADAAQKMQDSTRKKFTRDQRKWLIGMLVRGKKRGKRNAGVRRPLRAPERIYQAGPQFHRSV
jgi:hypothetical protein